MVPLFTLPWRATENLGTSLIGQKLCPRQNFMSFVLLKTIVDLDFFFNMHHRLLLQAPLWPKKDSKSQIPFSIFPAEEEIDHDPSSFLTLHHSNMTKIINPYLRKKPTRQPTQQQQHDGTDRTNDRSTDRTNHPSNSSNDRPIEPPTAAVQQQQPTATAQQQRPIEGPTTTAATTDNDYWIQRSIEEEAEQQQQQQQMGIQSQRRIARSAHMKKNAARYKPKRRSTRMAHVKL